jgi:hypothetical protein
LYKILILIVKVFSNEMKQFYEGIFLHPDPPQKLL